MHPFYVIRAIGGALYLLGALIMVYNCWRTIRGDLKDEKVAGIAASPRPASAVAAQ